jgi:hypothetical protein
MLCAVAIIITAIVSATLSVTVYAACVIAGGADDRMKD